jgi:hypothetical protein
MKWSLLPKQERGLEIAGFESIKAQLEIIEKAYTNDEMLAMFDDMNVTETSGFHSTKGKYSRCLYQFNGYKKYESNCQKRNARQEEC